jgi:NTP pyrophosphatase (non-canonical NTP hydrolase)
MSKYSEFFLLSSPEYCELNEKLRLRSYKSWLTEEVWCREAQNKKKAKFSLEVIRLARKIAKAKGIVEDEAFQLLQSNGEDREELLQEFGDEVNEIMELAPSNREQFEELVTLFFKNRGEVLEGKKWTSTSDWSKEDTQMLPSNILSSIEAFIAEEEGYGEESSEEEEDSPK